MPKEMKPDVQTITVPSQVLLPRLMGPPELFRLDGVNLDHDLSLRFKKFCDGRPVGEYLYTNMAGEIESATMQAPVADGGGRVPYGRVRPGLRPIGRKAKANNDDDEYESDE